MVVAAVVVVGIDGDGDEGYTKNFSLMLYLCIGVAVVTIQQIHLT